MQVTAAPRLSLLLKVPIPWFRAVVLVESKTVGDRVDMGRNRGRQTYLAGKMEKNSTFGLTSRRPASRVLCALGDAAHNINHTKIGERC